MNSPAESMSIVKFRVDEALAGLPPATPVKAPLGDLVAQVASLGFPSASCPTSKSGVWRCSPGVWRRQVVQAEFCVFLEGDCVFTPDGGPPIAIGAGEAVYFPAGSGGVWDIRSQATKLFIVFDERA
ncbi:cupin domain-containing protein [Phenylobacterium sp.]|uniref:cupin domain-containing protein n=1 Tax=Phenylobacterium sp. TaxID=1871053 RepID=UPI00301BD450